MLKKVVSFIVFFYGFISSNDAAAIYNAESEVGYDLNVQFMESLCPVNYNPKDCSKTTDYIFDYNIPECMYELQSLIEEVLQLKEYNYMLQIEINRGVNHVENIADQVNVKNNIFTNIKTAFLIMKRARCVLDTCENYLDATKKEYFTKINIVDDKNKPDIDAMKSGVEKICEDIFQSCTQVDKIYYKKNVEIILAKLIRFSTKELGKHLSSWNKTLLSDSIDSDSSSVMRANATSEISGLYYYIDYLRFIINGCETFFTSLNKEIGAYDIDTMHV